MKKKIFPLFIAIAFSSCVENNNEIANPLQATWNLISVQCFCEPIDLEEGEQIWTFDLSASKLEVINNVVEPPHTLLETGTYDITVTDSTVLINTVVYDYYFENEMLFLADNPESDGPLIRFVQN